MISTPEQVLRARLINSGVYAYERDFKKALQSINEAIFKVYQYGAAEISITDAAFLPVCQYLVTHGCKIARRSGNNCKIVRS